MTRPSDKTTVGHEGPAYGQPEPAAGTRSVGDPVDRRVVPGLSAHERIGRFVVVRKLGAGGMGVVYEAVDSEHGGRVALKTLRSVNPRAAQRFKKEFRALADLSHDNVVELKELHAADEQLFFTMELIHGSDLLTWVRAPGSTSGWTHDDLELHAGPDYDRLAAALRQLVLGVDAVHQHGKLHRDLKPSNVLVTEDGRVVVLDFGLVRDADTGDEEGLTVSGMVMGTPAYMSPEQADGRPLTPASDWYAVGVMMYQALTGDLPHSGEETDVGMLVAKSTRPAPDPRLRNPATPVPLATLCLALLARNPKQRPDTGGILAALPAGDGPSKPAPSRVESPLLGRDAALSTLHAAYDSASLGRTVVTLVDGPSGIGKSSIVEHFLRSLRRRNGESTVVLRGRCYERESVPYKALDPLIDHLTRYLRRLPPAEMAALLPRQIHALTRLFPALLDVDAIDRAPRRAPADARELRQRAFAALQELLGRITDRRPLVLFIDDLQWTDDDSASLLLELLRPPDSPHMLLIAAYREEDAVAASNPGLARLVDGLAAARPKLDIRTITVGPLPGQHATMLTRVLLSEHGLPRSMAERLASESEGNPLLAGELVRHLANTADSSDLPVEELGSPRLADVLEDRIDSLPQTSRDVLRLVALAGRRILLSTVLTAAASASDEHDPVARLRAGHFVRTIGPPQRRVIESYHDRIRKATVDAMSDAERRDAHAALAGALQRQGDADPEQLLLHYRAAGDDAQAGVFAVTAAARASAQLAFDRAAALFDMALQLDAGDRAKLQRQRGEALANAGRAYDAAQAYLAAAKLEDGAVRIELKRLAAVHLLEAGYTEQGRAELTEVLSAHRLKIPGSRGSVIAALLLRRAKLKLRGLGWKENDNVDAAVQARLDACWSASRGLVITDIFEGGYFQAEHLLLALASGDPPRVAIALAEEAKSASYFGDRGLTRARALLGDVHRLAERLDTPELRGTAIAAEALVALLSARWVDSVERNREAEALFRDQCTGVQQAVFDTMAGQAAALYAIGDLPQLETLCHRAALEATQRANIYHATMARFFLASPLALARDDVGGAQEQLEATTAYSRERGIQVAEIQIFNSRAAVAIYGRTAARQWDEHRQTFEAMRSNPLMRASFAQAEVMSWHGRLCLAAAEDNPEQRTQYLAVARKLAKNLLRQSFPSAVPMGQLLRAALAHIGGDDDRACEDLRNAGDRFEALDMKLSAAAARRRLGTLLGGDRGFILRGRADKALVAAGIKNNDACLRLWAPGFDS